jgi:hypothetical protein
MMFQILKIKSPCCSHLRLIAHQTLILYSPGFESGTSTAHFELSCSFTASEGPLRNKMYVVSSNRNQKVFFKKAVQDRREFIL